MQLQVALTNEGRRRDYRSSLGLGANAQLLPPMYSPDSTWDVATFATANAWSASFGGPSLPHPRASIQVG
jgi:hypothetical protein